MELELAIASALRLSEIATQARLVEIQRHIAEARAELIRLGISASMANGDNILIESAIISYALSKMSAENMQQKYLEDFKCQVDNLRKSKGFTDEE